MKKYELIVPCHFGMEAVLKNEIIDLGYDVSEVTAAYCGAFADGVFGPDELDAVNAQCDSKIDKYVDDAMIDKVIDGIIK